MMTEKYPTWLIGHVKEWAEKRLPTVILCSTTIKRTPSRKKTTRRYPLLCRWTSRVPVGSQSQFQLRIAPNKITAPMSTEAMYQCSCKNAVICSLFIYRYPPFFLHHREFPFG